MGRKDYSQIDKNKPAIKAAILKIDEFRKNAEPIGSWLNLLGLSNWKIEMLLHSKEVKKNGIADVCKQVEGEWICTFDQASEWYEIFQKEKRPH